MLGFFTWLATLLRPRPVPTPTPTPTPGDVVVEMIAAINAERDRRGFRRLVADPRLVAVAQGWADRMAAARNLDHGDFSARIKAVYPDAWAAENIATGSTVQQVVASWLASPPHRANMIGDYSRAGVGHSGGYWCLALVR